MIPGSNNYYEIKEIYNLINNMEPTDSLYQYLNSELLMQVYTSYETFLKEVLVKLFTEAKTNYKYSPFLIDHKLWKVIENKKSYIVPKGRKEDLIKNFPLIKDCYFYNYLDQLDTIVNERNSFAHTGKHKASFEQIMNGYIVSLYIQKYINYCYLKADDVDILKFKEVQIFISDFISHACKIVDPMNCESFPDDFNVFDTYVLDYQKLLSNKSFNVSSDIEEICSEENFNFLINYRTKNIDEFKKSLEKLKIQISKSSFGIPSIEKINNTQIFNFMNSQ